MPIPAATTPTAPGRPELVIGRRSGVTRLPVVLLLPLAGGDLVLATRDTWPVAKDLFCAELEAWPEDAEVIERVPVASCRRVGASVQLVLERTQRRRSLFVWTSKRGRPLIFWRSERSMKATRPGIRTPSARGLDGPLTVAVDLRERYAWRFKGVPVTLERRRLPVGDYGVFEGERLVAVVERKRLEEFAGAAVQGQLQLLMAELATMPRAAIVIEGRLSQLVKGDLRTRPGWLLNLVAALQAAYPNVPLLFAETGPLAADLAYRWLSAALRLARAHAAGEAVPEVLAAALGPSYGPSYGPSASLGDAGRDAGALSDATGLDPGAPPDAAAGLREAPLFAAPERVEVARASTSPDRAGRQDDALTRARGGEAVTIKEHAERHGITSATASLDLRELERRGLLRAHGQRRSLRFTAAG